MRCSNGTCKSKCRNAGIPMPDVDEFPITYTNGQQRCGECQLKKERPDLFVADTEAVSVVNSKKTTETKTEVKVDPDSGVMTATVETTEVPADPIEFLKSRGLNVEDYQVTHSSVTTWTTTMKIDGAPTQVLNFRLQVKFVPRVINPVGYGLTSINFVPPVAILPQSTREGRKVETVFVIPDTHFGYRVVDGVLTPTHDEAAMDSVLRLVEYVNPNQIVLLGDTMDFPEFGRHPHGIDLRSQTEKSIQAAAEFLYRLRAVTSCPIDVLEGNHDKRPTDYVRDALRVLSEVPGIEVKLPSVAEMLNLKGLDITYHGGPTKEGFDAYSAGGSFFRYRSMLYLHGYACGKEALINTLNTYQTSICMGHIHKQACISKMVPVPTPSGLRYRRMYALSPGYLGVQTTALPGISPERNYHQGVALVHHLIGDGDVEIDLFIEQIGINDGRSVYNGRVF